MKKRVLFLLHDVRVHGGANSSMFDVLERLNGVEIFIAIPKKNKELQNYLENKGYKYFIIPYPTWIYRVYNPWYKKFIRIVQQYIRQLKLIYVMPILRWIIIENNIDIIYTNTFCMYIGCLANKYWKITHFWHIREYGLEDHGFGVIFGYKILKKFFNKYTDKVIFISKSLANKYINEIENKRKVFVIYDDVSKKYIIKKKKKDDYINILVAGLIQSGKGQLEIVKAFEKVCKKNKSLRLYIAGERGSIYCKEVQQYVKFCGLEEKVFFLGFVNNMNELRSNMDIGVVASKSEAFGRVTIEGMLGCMAMIGADVAATSELIQDGKTGLLYRYGDINDLANKIENLATDASLRKQLAHNGCEYAIKNFSSGRGARYIEKLICMDEEEYITK